MADTIKVKFLRQKVYHDGTSMVVKKADESGEIDRRLVATFIAEGVIAKPKGWSEDLAEKNSLARADGGVQSPPADGSGGDESAPTGDEEEDEGEGDELPSLSGKNKAELLAIAEAEGVTVEDGATNAEIVAAIEAGREAGDEAPAA